MTPRLIRLDSCPSTNDAAKSLARAGAPAGTAVTAEEQTAGRGTKGRLWHSPRGLGLYVSLILKPSSGAPALLPLAAGLAAREAILKAADVAVSLKWPNDILWKGRKLGGVLCESVYRGRRLEFVVAGVGLNVGHASADFPEGLRGLAASLRMAAGRPVDREALLEDLLAALRKRAAEAAAADASSLTAEFEGWAIHKRGDFLRLESGGETFSASFEGLGPDGALIVRTTAGPRRFLSAEILRVR